MLDGRNNKNVLLKNKIPSTSTNSYGLSLLNLRKSLVQQFLKIKIEPSIKNQIGTTSLSQRNAIVVSMCETASGKLSNITENIQTVIRSLSEQVGA